MPEENGNNNNVTPITQEVFDQLKTELDAERSRVSESIDAATAPLNERIASLEQQLQAKGEEAAQQTALATERGNSFASLTAQHDTAVNAYRELVLKSNPVIPPDMVQGASIEELNASVEKASALIGQIQQSITQQTQTNTQVNTVPAGAPVRNEPDIDSMSTREKITHGLNQAKNKFR